MNVLERLHNKSNYWPIKKCIESETNRVLRLLVQLWEIGKNGPIKWMILYVEIFAYVRRWDNEIVIYFRISQYFRISFLFLNFRIIFYYVFSTMHFPFSFADDNMVVDFESSNDLRVKFLKLWHRSSTSIAAL